jgi:hypothetical protein
MVLTVYFVISSVSRAFFATVACKIIASQA